MARIASIAVFAMASDFMEDDEDEVEAVYELGWEDFLLDEGTCNPVLLQSLCSHAAAFPCQLRSVSPRSTNRTTRENLHLKFLDHHDVLFRFSSNQILLLITALEVPEHMTFNGCRTTAVEAMCIFLHRLATKCRYSDMVVLFDRHPKFLSQVYLGMNIFIYEKWGNKITEFDQTWTTGRHWLDRYAASTSQRGSPVTDLVGWVDGTFVQVARPGTHQRAHYCGHRGCHCFKVQVLAYPCGLITSFGPFPGPTHDAAAVRQLRLDEVMVQKCSFDDRSFVLYMDKAYGMYEALITPYSGHLTVQEEIFNRRSANLRVSVEHLIGLVKTTWASLGEVNRMSISRSPVATFWLLKLDIGHGKISTDRKFCANLLLFLQVQCMPLDQPADHNQWWELGD